MNWYDFDYQVAVELDQSLDLYTRQNNLVEMFRMFKTRIDEIDGNAANQISIMEANKMVLETEILNLKEENRILKHLVKKMALKDYPELVFENPQWFENKTEEM